MDGRFEMKIYNVMGKEYQTICSVHGALRNLISDLNVHLDLKHEMLTLVDVANQMAVSMEEGLNRNRTPWGVATLYNVPEPEEDNGE